MCTCASLHTICCDKSIAANYYRKLRSRFRSQQARHTHKLDLTVEIISSLDVKKQQVLPRTCTCLAEYLVRSVQKRQFLIKRRKSLSFMLKLYTIIFNIWFWITGIVMHYLYVNEWIHFQSCLACIRDHMFWLQRKCWFILSLGKVNRADLKRHYAVIGNIWIIDACGEWFNDMWCWCLQ